MDKKELLHQIRMLEQTVLSLKSDIQFYFVFGFTWIIEIFFIIKWI
jgi:hypothetical protein